MNIKITIIGFGTMGQAIKKALLSNAKNIKISIISRDADLESLKKADFIILAVKPKDIKEIAGQIQNKINSKSIIISILAGTKIKTISKLFGVKKIVRMMPNLGLSVGAGIAFWKKEGKFSAKENIAIKKFLNSICENFETKDEKVIDAVTAISGSGPAYFFLLADAMLKTARKLKLDENTSRKLVSQTFLASALLSQEADYQELIAKIASKNGTTEAALKVFKKEKFNVIVEKAIKAAHQRAQEISNKK